MSKTEFAERVGVSAATVRQWVGRAKLSGAAVTASGRIRVDEAERQLAARLDPRRGRPRNATKPGSFAERLQLQRIEEGAIRLRRARRAELAERGRYTLTEGVRREYARGFRQLVDAVESWLLYEVPNLLSLSADDRATLRTAWHRFRTREAEAAQRQAEALPEFVLDPIAAGAAVRDAESGRKKGGKQ